MKIIDCHTGRELRVGDVFHTCHDGARYQILSVKEGIFSAEIVTRGPNGKIVKGPLVVRYTHPGFPFQKVGFIPT